IQLINLGYVEIAFHKNNHLQLTPFSKQVLFDKEKVHLAHIPEGSGMKEKKEKPSRRKEDSLFENLRQLRLKIAQEKDLPAYLIFNDATLKEMEKERPVTEDEFVRINGVGRKKMQDFGYQFIKEIRSYKDERPPKMKKTK